MYATAKTLLYQDPVDTRKTDSLPSQTYTFNSLRTPLELLDARSNLKVQSPSRSNLNGRSNEPSVPQEKYANPQLKNTLPSLPSVPESISPKVWGKYFWTQLHLAATYYPENPSPIFQERMKGRILAIPYEVPCANCRNHALSFLEKNQDKLDQIVSGKHELGRFFTDFHNYVNVRYNKPKWSYEKVLAHYGNPGFKLE